MLVEVEMNTTQRVGVKRVVRMPIGYRRGFSLIEIAMGIGLTALVSISVMQIVNEQTAASRAVSAAGMISQVQAASQDYIKANYSRLLTAVPVGANPIAIRAGRPSDGAPVPAGPTGTLPSLQGGGFLPLSFVDRDNYRFRHVLLVRQTVGGTLEGLVVQASDAELGLGPDNGTPIRDNELGRMVARMGSVGGARFTTNVVPASASSVKGNGGQWTTTATDWAASGFTPQTGRAAARLSFGNAALISDYLNRYDIGIPEASTMRNVLNMGNNSITAANDVASKTVTASNTVVAGTGATSNPATMPGLSMYMASGGIACAGNAVGCKFWISKDSGFASYADGWTRYQGSVAGTGLSIEGAGNSLYVGGDATLNSNLSVAGNQTVAGTLSVTGITGLASDLSVGGRLSVTQDSSFGGKIDVAGNGSFGGDVGVGGNLNVTNTVAVGQSLGTGLDIYAGRNLSVGNDAYVNNNLTVAQDTQTGRNLTVGGDSILKGYLTVAGNATVSGSLAVSGAANVTGAATTGALVNKGTSDLFGKTIIYADPPKDVGLYVMGDVFLEKGLTVRKDQVVKGAISGGNIYSNGIVSVGYTTVIGATCNTGLFGDGSTYGSIARSQSHLLYCNGATWQLP